MRLDLPCARVERTSDGHAFFFESQYGYAYILSKTGAFLAERLLMEECGQEDLVTAVTEQFDIKDEMNVTQDVVHFIENMRRYGLLT